LADAIKLNSGGIIRNEFYFEGLIPISEGGGVVHGPETDLG